MKHLLLILLMCCRHGYGQVEMNVDEQEILYLEVNRLKSDFIAVDSSITGNAVVIDKKIQSYWPVEGGYTIWTAKNGLTEAEAVEIFGNKRGQRFNMPATPLDEWSTEDFKELNVFLFDEDIHIASELKYGYAGKNSIRTYNVLHLTLPVVRKDGKYAIIEFSGGIHGGVMSIYKKVNKRWILYKTVAIYVS